MNLMSNSINVSVAIIRQFTNVYWPFPRMIGEQLLRLIYFRNIDLELLLILLHKRNRFAYKLNSVQVHMYKMDIKTK